jgi:hypothetical protein
VIGITVFRFPLARDTCTAPILLWHYAELQCP